MSMEADLVTTLSAVCSQVYPDVAPAGVTAPYITWQGIGGESARFIDNSAADKRNTIVQISVWATTRLEALSLIRSVEDALCAAAAYIATPQGESRSTWEPDTKLYGSIQRFSVWATR